MEKYSISEIVSAVRNGGHVIKLALSDASKYASNSHGEMQWDTSAVEKKYAYRQEGDEIIQNGNKEVNISELVRILKVMVGRGEAQVRIGSQLFYGEIVEG